MPTIKSTKLKLLLWCFGIYFYWVDEASFSKIFKKIKMGEIVLKFKIIYSLNSITISNYNIHFNHYLPKYISLP